MRQLLHKLISITINFIFYLITKIKLLFKHKPIRNYIKNWYKNKIKIKFYYTKIWKLIIFLCFFIVLLLLFNTMNITLIELYTLLFKFINNFILFKIEILNYYITELYVFIFIIFFIYFLNTVIMSLLSYLFGVNGIFVISLISILMFWFIQFYFIDIFFFDSITVYANFEFINYIIGTAPFKFSLKIDFISYCFLFLTTSIGVCAIIYSLNYFKNEPHTDRFILLLNWFILSMSLLITADNALLLFLGWEMIGLISFLLINFWTQRRNTLKSAFKAFTYNKVSDVFLLFFIIIITHQTSSLNLTIWYNYFLIQSNYKITTLVVASLFLILASSIKSAQFLGHLWLPDSMEAPIPASALIHSATLVSAGIYLLLRFNWIIKYSNLTLFILFLGSITAIYGAIVSAAQTDCKKLLAYSTISHCGFLFITIGLNNIYLTITYLYLHGLFKALTFFCIGNLIKVSKGYQDTRKMGQLFLVLPVESVLLIICSINLGALPFTVGYFYKFLFQALIINTNFYFVLLPLIFIAMLSSIIYVFRLIYYSIFDIYKGNSSNFNSFFKFNYNNNKYSNTTVLGTIFISSLLIFTIYIYINYLLFFKNFIFFNPTHNLEILDILQNIKNNNITYYHLFYIFFSVAIFILIKIECRVEFSYLKKNFIIYYFFIFIIFLQIITYLQPFFIL